MLYHSRHSGVVVALPTKTGLSLPTFRLIGAERHAFISARSEAASNETLSPNEIYQHVERGLDNFYN